MIQYLINKGAYLFFNSLKFGNLFNTSIYFEQYHLVPFFLEFKLDIENYSFPKTSPLSLLIEKKKIDIIQLIIEKGYYFKDPKYLKDAFLTNDFEIIDLIITFYSDEIIFDLSNCESPFFYAFHLYNLQLIEYLFKKGFYIIKNNYELFINNINFETLRFHIDIINFLLINNFDINSVNDQGINLLYHCVNSKDLKTVEFLIDKGININKVSIVKKLCTNGSLDMLKFYLEKGLNLDYLKNENALSLSIQSNNDLIAQYLINNDLIFLNNDINFYF